jgi:alpha-mannosidase
VAVAAATCEAEDKPDQAPGDHPGTPFCYVDGYHGGVDGHMPPGSLRDVMDGLDKFPKWKVSFEIEPYSWAVFAKSDPAASERLRQFLADGTPKARVELVSGAYGQPYMWNISGESIIRHLVYGRQEIRAVFPDARVDTYAVQEPCWTSCLPQVLKSLGYRRAVLKNSTCWGGYHAATIDADIVWWVGPDGSEIPAVPRYASEALVAPATEEGAQPPGGFVERCMTAGITHPAGTILQDMGWPGRPWRLGLNEQIFKTMRHVTWREYTEAIADAPTKSWKASQEDLRVSLAWGAPILQRMSQIVRASEGQIVQAEKLASMAKARHGTAYPAEALKAAWVNLLLSQHHDAWIVPSNHHHRGGTWASDAEARHAVSDESCRTIIRESAAAMAGAAKADPAAGFVRVFNTTGFARQDIAQFEVAGGHRDLAVTDADGKPVPSQTVAAADGAVMLFRADVPAMGYATYHIGPAGPAATSKPLPSAIAEIRDKGATLLESDEYKLTIDPSRGGVVTSLFCKATNREFVNSAGPRGFGEFRGFFGQEHDWLSSAQTPARITVTESGPVRAAVRIEGHIGPHPFTTVLSLTPGQRRIDFQTNFDLPVADHEHPDRKVLIGQPWEKGRDTMRSNQRPLYNNSYKLQVLFPAAIKRPTLFKNAPFDVCRSTLDDTTFSGWDSIKHNVIVNWVDLAESDGTSGLAVLTDHTTAYSLTRDEPLGIVMCYAGPGVWWDYSIDHKPSVRYALVPHAGDWMTAQLSREQARWSEPLVVAAASDPAGKDPEWSLLDASGGSIHVVTAFEHDGATHVRLFNAADHDAELEIGVASTLGKIELIEMDGRLISEVPIIRQNQGHSTIKLKFAPFGVQTLRAIGHA